MSERLSDEAKRMCRMCSIVSTNGECNLLNRTTATQNRLAKEGECRDAKVHGLTVWYPELYGEVMGRVVRIDGDWLFQGGKYSPI